jgi:arylsulfatase A-like enzyme
MTRPNIIWILGDQHRAQALSCFGNTQLATPNIDSLSDTPTTGVAGCPLCSPFRGSMLTGAYPHCCVPGHDVAMPDGRRTIGHVFGENGYRTAYFGKWHVDGDTYREKGRRPAFQTVVRERRGGFSTWLGYENNNSQYDSWIHGHEECGNEVPHTKLEGYETDALTSLLTSFIAGHRHGEGDVPFFAVLSVQPPHSPYVAPERFASRHTPDAIRLRPNVPPVSRVQNAARRDLAGYYAMIENLDWNVGRILDALRENGLADNTIIVFFSDHGDMHGSHGRILKCVPYEESIRIPFIVGTASASVRLTLRPTAPSPHLVNHVDIPVTTLGLCGIDAPADMAGVDYSGCWLENRDLPADAPGSAFLQLVDPGWTNRLASDRERPWRGVLTRDGWKYVVLEGQPWLMFDLNEDPYELANLALDGRFSKKRAELQECLEGWLARTGDGFALPDIPVHG